MSGRVEEIAWTFVSQIRGRRASVMTPMSKRAYPVAPLVPSTQSRKHTDGYRMGEDMKHIPWGTLVYPNWGRIPTFFESGPELEYPPGMRPDRRESDSFSVVRRTQLDGVAYMVRGGNDISEAFRYVDCRPGMRRALFLFRHNKSIFDMMDNFPALLVYHALK